MKECEECGKTLGTFEGYQHPTMGKKHNLCSPCFDNVNDSVDEWKKFVVANSFNNGHKKSFGLKWKNFAPNFDPARDLVSNVRAESTLFMRRK